MHEQSWQNRITRFLIAQAISLLGSSIVQFAIIWYITLETSSGLMLTYSTVASFVPQIFVSLFAGVLLDRYDRKLIIMVADTAIAVTTLVLFFIIRSGVPSLSILFIALAIRSIGTGVQNPAVNAVIPQLVPERELIRINGFFVSMTSLIAFLSPAIAATVLSGMGLPATLLVDMITALIGVGITATTYFPPLRHSGEEAVSSWQGLKDAFAYLRTHSLLKRLFAFEGVILFLFSPLFMMALIVERSFGGEYWQLAATEVAFGIGAVIGGLFIGWWGGFKNRMTTVLASALILGSLMFLLGLASFWVFLALLFVWGIFNPTYDTPFITLLQERVEPDMHGRIFGFLQIVIAASLPLGMILFGPLGDIISVEHLFMSSGILIVAWTIFGRYGLRLEEV
jgi:DHA3 family macrolide efflux protein-like MFS transporter